MRRLFAFLAVWAMLGTVAIAAEPFRWTNVGGDPCNPEVCTLIGTLDKAVEVLKWPKEVKYEFLRDIADLGGRGEPAVLKSGQRFGFMTFGVRRFRFEPNTIAAWPPGHTEEAMEWTVDYKELRYHLGRAEKCRNYYGYTEPAPKPIVLKAEPVVAVVPPVTPVVAQAPPPEKAKEPVKEPEIALGVVPRLVSCN